MTWQRITAGEYRCGPWSISHIRKGWAVAGPRAAVCTTLAEAKEFASHAHLSEQLWVPGISSNRAIRRLSNNKTMLTYLLSQIKKSEQIRQWDCLGIFVA